MQSKECKNCKKDFVIEPDDFGFYEKIKVPPPTFCPECRFQRRMSWRNDTSLYNRKCDLCTESVVSMYAPDSGIIIYCNKCWWSDKWDPYDYGVDYDFSKDFFTQFQALMLRVPHIGLVNDNGISSVGCEYTGDCWFAKNCYMTFCAWKIENVLYSYLINGGKDMMDCLEVFDTSDWMYECINCDRCYKTRNMQLCLSCTDSSFLFDCRNCSNCFMCTGLRNQKYCFKNKQYSKEEYEKILIEYKLDTFSGTERAEKEYDEFILHTPRRYAQVFKCLNCTGDVLTNGKNSKDCFRIDGPENCRFVQQSIGPMDSYDLTTAGELSESYEGVVTDHSDHNLFGLFSVKSQYLEYTMHCHASKYLFGCVGLKNGEYSIFNKRYTKEEYQNLREKIHKQMMEMPYVDKVGNEYRYGEFFPIELSVFGYNESIAPQAFPLTKEQALSAGYHWQDHTQKTTGKETMAPDDIPNSISAIPDSFTDETLACTLCNRNYKIITEELRFYKTMNIPIPRCCFYCRSDKRFSKRNPFKLWHRACMCEKGNHDHEGKCVNEFETSYSPERPEIVYCESCYQKEVI